MADISTPVVYSKQDAAKLKAKLIDALFTHNNWSDDDLATFRATVREYYRTAQNGLCAFCKSDISLRSANNCNVEHIVPKSLRREFIFEPKNLCVICADCNEIKRAKEILADIPNPLSKTQAKLYPRSSKAFLIVHPHFDKWDDHIINFGSLYLDLTDKGNFTIGACTLNRRLRKFGWEAVIASDADVRAAASEWLNATDAIIASRKFSILKRLIVLT